MTQPCCAPRGVQGSVTHRGHASRRLSARTAVRYARKNRGGHRLRRAEQVDLAFRSLLPPGLSNAGTAAKLSVSEATVKRTWAGSWAS
jgi:hypothetical protein